MGTAVISTRRIEEMPGPDGLGYREVICISSWGAGTPTKVQSQLGTVRGAHVTIHKAAPTTLPRVTFGGVAAAGTFTAAANPTAADTVTIGTLSSSGLGTSKVYRFVASLTGSVANDVLIGADASESLDNLIAAINGAAGGGTTYNASTTAHPDVSAAAGAGDTMVVTARGVGAKYTQIPTTETGAQLSWGAATLAGGEDQNVCSINFTSAGDDNSACTLEVFGSR